MSREYVSTEFKCRRISVIVQRSASDKLADVDKRTNELAMVMKDIRA